MTLAPEPTRQSDRDPQRRRRGPHTSTSPASRRLRLPASAHPAGSTLALYSADCSSKISQLGMLTTRAANAFARERFVASTHVHTSEPVPIRITCGFGSIFQNVCALAHAAVDIVLRRIDHRQILPRQREEARRHCARAPAASKRRSRWRLPDESRSGPEPRAASSGARSADASVRLRPDPQNRA